MFYSATHACHGNGASKASAGSGVLRVSGATAHPRVPVTAPCPGKDALPFLSPAPWLCMDATKESLFPEIKARLLPGRERGGRREIRGECSCCPCADTSRPSAIPLGKWDTPWEGVSAPNSSTWVMCWRPEPKSDPNPSAPHHGGRGMLTQIWT